MWAIVFPLMFWSMYRVESITNMKDIVSPVFIVALYFYLFLVLANIFKWLFIKIRNQFPYTELITASKKNIIAQQLFVYTVLLTLLATPLWDFCKYCFVQFMQIIKK